MFLVWLLLGFWFVKEHARWAELLERVMFMGFEIICEGYVDEMRKINYKNHPLEKTLRIHVIKNIIVVYM